MTKAFRPPCACTAKDTLDPASAVSIIQPICGRLRSGSCCSKSDFFDLIVSNLELNNFDNAQAALQECKRDSIRETVPDWNFRGIR